jgi:hypothetical protein
MEGPRRMKIVSSTFYRKGSMARKRAFDAGIGGEGGQPDGMEMWKKHTSSFFLY